MSNEPADTAEFRPLPTPEQVRAHGDGGLWEGENGQLYKLFDRDCTAPWWDSSASSGTTFCYHGGPWSGSSTARFSTNAFRPLRAIGKPRPWSEIDAAVAAASSQSPPVTTTPAQPEYGAPADDTAFRPGCPSVAHVEAAQRLGLEWRSGQTGNTATQYIFDVRNSRVCIRLKAGELSSARPYGEHRIIGCTDRTWRPAKPDDTVVAWPTLDAEVKRHEAAAATKRTQAMVTGIPMTLSPSLPSLSVDTTGLLRARADSLGDEAKQQIVDAVKAALPVAVRGSDGVHIRAAASKLPSDGDAMSVAGAVAVAREGARQAMADMGAVFLYYTLDTAPSLHLTALAEQVYGVSRKLNETDEQLRQRCRDKWTPSSKETTTMTPIPNFVNMTPEDRARYRTALDAAEPPTFKSALMSGLEHAPIEGALDRAHKLLDEAVTTFWVAGSEDDKATVRRFFRDLLTSEYGKAGMAFGAGALLPYAADAAESLLPGDNAAPRYINRAAWLFTERGATITARELGGAAIDAIGPLLGTLRRLLVDLVAGMRVAEKGVAGLLQAAPVRSGGDLFGAAGVVADTEPTSKV